MTAVIAMIPARMGSQRLKRKNLRELGGIPLITRAIRKCKAANMFSEVWVNSEGEHFRAIAEAGGARFHARPPRWANDTATSEDFVAEFLEAHQCEFVVQVHSIAPLATVDDIHHFVQELKTDQYDCLLSAEPIQIECAYEGQPVNFRLDRKENSQDLRPVQRISWSLTAWRRRAFLAAAADGRCATYAGRVGYFQMSRFASHVIKTEEDLQVAAALLPLVPGA